VVHALLERVLTQLQLLVVLGQLGDVSGDHLLPALEGLPFFGEPVLGGMELLLSEAKFPLTFTSFCFSTASPASCRLRLSARESALSSRA
jgi:hypothetical protein